MKRAIVFGATGGIGQAICQDLAESGWSLYLHYNSKDKTAEELVQKLFAKYPKQDFMPIKLNFETDDAQLSKFVKNLLPVNAKGEVRLRSVVSFGKRGNVCTPIFSSSFSLPPYGLSCSMACNISVSSSPKNIEITAGGASNAPRR